MKIRNIICLVMAAGVLSSAEAVAAETASVFKGGLKNIFGANKDRDAKEHLFQAGVRIGTDIGGAVPVPFRYIPETFNPYPQLNINVGVFTGFKVHDRWSLGLDFVYKTVALKADARVSAQKYEDKKEGLLQYYTGTAKMDMSFTMFELPFYVRYHFRNATSNLLFGGYVAFNRRTEFETLATKGYSGSAPDKVEVIIGEGDAPINMSFSSALRDFDGGLMVGYERTLYRRVNVGVRFTMGLADIFKHDAEYFDYKMLQMRGSISVGYKIFD